MQPEVGKLLEQERLHEEERGRQIGVDKWDRHFTVLFSWREKTAPDSHMLRKYCIIQSDVKTRGAGRGDTDFYKDRQQRAVVKERDRLSHDAGGVRRSKRAWCWMYKKWTEAQESTEEQKRISSIIQSHPSNDRQIERPQIIFKTNKLLKDEVPPLLASHFKFLRPYLFETIANLQQSAEIKAPQQCAQCAVLITTGETELTGHQRCRGR